MRKKVRRSFKKNTPIGSFEDLGMGGSYSGFVNALRTAFQRSYAYHKAMDDSISCEVGSRGGKLYTCASCGGSFQIKNVQVDHIRPVATKFLVTRQMTPEQFIRRLGLTWGCRDDDKITSSLQVLCKGCHDVKSEKDKSAKTAYSKRYEARLKKQGKWRASC